MYILLSALHDRHELHATRTENSNYHEASVTIVTEVLRKDSRQTQHFQLIQMTV